jgi:ADP-heptose:LPS heptosyltransferase
MKWIDTLIGIPLCLAVSPLALCLNRARARLSLTEESTDSLLFIKLLGMGSILLTTPTLQAIRQCFPKTRFHLLTFSSNRPLAENLQLFDRVSVIRTKNIMLFLYDTLAFVLGCWRRPHAAAVDFEFFSRFSALLSFFSGSNRRIGFHSPLAWRGWLLTDGVFFTHYRHITRNFMALGKALGAEPSDATLSPMRFTEYDERVVEQRLKQEGVGSRDPLFLINVNATDMCLERRWPPASFDQLVQCLRRRVPQAWYVFIGAPNERAYVDAVLSSFKDSARTLNVAGQLTLSGLAALMKRSTLLITSESGPLHFAQSLGLPSVSLFGPGPPPLFGPLDHTKHRVLYADVHCSPCLNYYSLTGPTCHGDNICMKYITPAQVEQQIAELLKNLPAPYPSP